MSQIDYTREDTLDVALFMPKNPIIDGVDGIKPLLQALDSTAGPLAPDKIAGRTVVNYSHSNFLKLLEQQKRHSKIVLDLMHTGDPEVSYEWSFVEEEAIGSWLRIIVPFSYFEGPNSRTHSQQILNLVRAIANACPVAYGYAHSKGDLALGNDPHIADPFAPQKIYEAHWLNLYGSQMVDQIGRERVLSVPCAHAETLHDGSVLWLTQPTPANYASKEARVAQARALTHLRPDRDYETELRRVSQRTGTLAQVEKKWDPDIADLLELMLDDVSYAERQQEIARLNEYKPPEVSESKSIDRLEPSDVANESEAVDLYSNHYAERLVALLHKDVPAAIQGSPDSLPRIDYHFWHFDFPGTFRREDIEKDLVPAIGAYVGEMLVHHLNGRWVPRRNLDESQVVVGDRVWLPFLRARRYMQNKQAVIDHSLTQFYRVAARLSGK